MPLLVCWDSSTPSFIYQELWAQGSTLGSWWKWDQAVPAFWVTYFSGILLAIVLITTVEGAIH